MIKYIPPPLSLKGLLHYLYNSSSKEGERPNKNLKRVFVNSDALFHSQPKFSCAIPKARYQSLVIQFFQVVGCNGGGASAYTFRLQRIFLMRSFYLLIICFSWVKNWKEPDVFVTNNLKR